MCYHCENKTCPNCDRYKAMTKLHRVVHGVVTPSDETKWICGHCGWVKVVGLLDRD